MTQQTLTPKKQHDHVVGGIILVGIGVIALISQFVDLSRLDQFILPGLGAAFLLWGIVQRKAGPLIPGGILMGIGLGSLVVANNTSDEAGGLFLIIFASGWMLIALLSAIFTAETQWWALIPAGIIGFIGMAVSVGGVAMTMLATLGKLWPLILIGVGIYVLIRNRN